MQNQNKKYDLEDRTQKFAQDCRNLTRKVYKTIENREDCKQLVRSSGSVAANYIEANESVGPKDFVLRIKICRKEAKESKLWLSLLYIEDKVLDEKRKRLAQEAIETTRIFGSIVEKCKQPNI